MGEVPDLLSLCMEAVRKEIIHGDHLLQNIYEIPPDLFDCLLTHSPPLALQKLQNKMPFKHWSYHESTTGSFKDGRKHGRYGKFNRLWKTLFKSRWPEDVRQIQLVDWLTKEGLARCKPASDWQQMYWEAHLQNCLDKAAETAVLPSFDGCIGEIAIADTIMKSIGYEERMDHTTCDYSTLSYHCQQFGCYARCLRLQNVLCVAEICQLLRNSKLQSVVIRRVKSKEHVNGVCKLLNQNNETLSSIEFIHCKLPSTSLNAIFDSLYLKGTKTHGVQHFSIKVSSFLKTNPVSVPPGLLSFLSSGRSLCSLNFCDNHLGPNFAKVVFDILLETSSGLTVLDLSENNIAGWLSTFKGRFSSCHPSSLGIGKSLQSLRVLNLRGNNLCKDDADGLKYALVHMPNLEILDISDNPIEDDGIRSLIPYLIEASERNSPLADVKIENCDLSFNGVTQLLGTLSTLKKPPSTLSIADNDLGSEISEPLAKFLGTPSIRVLNIEDIGLGASGFLELQEGIPEEVKLSHINISKNRGGIETANFVSKLILRAPELVAINAGYNFMPAESLAVLCSALKLSKGKLEQLDLTGNTRCYQPCHASMISQFQICGRPIVILPSCPAPTAPYDDDP